MSEKELLRKAAGLSFVQKKKLFEENTSRVKTMDVETELLRIFSQSVRDIKRIREIMEGSQDSYYSINGPGRFKLQDEYKKIDKKHLFDLAMDKLDILEESIADCFGFSKEKPEDTSVENSQEEESEEEEE